MAVRVAPTLARMAEVYRLPASGGAESPRFKSYAGAARSGEPVTHFNPMTSKPAGETVEALLGVGAEAVAAEAATAVLDELGAGQEVELVMFVTVATPGMWTDRVATEVEHRLGGQRDLELLFWTGEQIDAATVVRRARGQAVRAAWWAVDGDRRDTVRAAVAREGIALAVSRDGPVPRDDTAVADAVELLGSKAGFGDRACVVFGDRVAAAMGFTPLGLGDLAGARHGAARCEHTDIAAAFASGPAAPWL